MHDFSDTIKIWERQYGPFVHMAPLDKTIWTKYLMHGNTHYAPFVYDYRVGDGIVMPPNSGRTAERLGYMLGAKRIDVLAFVSAVPHIFEVKQYGGPAAIGQLVTYRDLFTIQHPNSPPPVLHLITDYLQSDMMPTLQALGVRFFETK